VSTEATVEQIFLRIAGTRRSVERAYLAAGLGLVPDPPSERYLQSAEGKKPPADRELSLLTSRASAERHRRSDNGLCFVRFQEDLTLLGVELETLSAGALIDLGEAGIVLTAETKSCFPQCALSEKASCPLARSVRFARVVRNGAIVRAR
jgi:hypothetical protein